MTDSCVGTSQQCRPIDFVLKFKPLWSEIFRKIWKYKVYKLFIQDGDGFDYLVFIILQKFQM